jgi:hypothetical protein
VEDGLLLFFLLVFGGVEHSAVDDSVDWCTRTILQTPRSHAFPLIQVIRIDGLVLTVFQFVLKSDSVPPWKPHYFTTYLRINSTHTSNTVFIYLCVVNLFVLRLCLREIIPRTEQRPCIIFILRQRLAILVILIRQRKSSPVFAAHIAPRKEHICSGARSNRKLRSIKHFI